jgi:hypothetical protein
MGWKEYHLEWYEHGTIFTDEPTKKVVLKNPDDYASFDSINGDGKLFAVRVNGGGRIDFTGHWKLLLSDQTLNPATDFNLLTATVVDHFILRGPLNCALVSPSRATLVVMTVGGR